MAKPKVESIVIEIIDQKPSGWILEGSADHDLPITLTVSTDRHIINRSAVRQEDGSHKAIRYIAGCDEIYEEEQKRLGIMPNPAEDKIWISGGRMTVPNEGRQRGLYKYLKACEYNEDAPNRPYGATAIFKEVKTEANAQNTLLNLHEEEQAMKMIFALARKQADNSFVYDTERIGFLCNLFKVQSFESEAERVAVLAGVAKSNPSYFVNTIADYESTMKVALLQALDMKVISFDGDRASFPRTNFAFYTFRAKHRDKRIEELAAFLITPEGKQAYDEMIIEAEAEKKRQLMLHA